MDIHASCFGDDFCRNQIFGKVINELNIPTLLIHDKNDKELTELFIKYGYSMIQIYFNMIKDPKFLDLCQNKIYNDNLIEFITTIDPTSTIELLNRIDNRNIESIMNCSNLIQAISNENFITKDEFT